MSNEYIAIRKRTSRLQLQQLLGIQLSIFLFFIFYFQGAGFFFWGFCFVIALVSSPQVHSPFLFFFFFQQKSFAGSLKKREQV
jgi:hypothetical protein